MLGWVIWRPRRSRCCLGTSRGGGSASSSHLCRYFVFIIQHYMYSRAPLHLVCGCSRGLSFAFTVRLLAAVRGVPLTPPKPETGLMDVP